MSGKVQLYTAPYVSNLRKPIVCVQVLCGCIHMEFTTVDGRCMNSYLQWVDTTGDRYLWSVKWL